MAFDLGKSGFGEKIKNSKLEKIQMIRLNEIEANEKNFYDVSDTAELEASIEMVGLMSPVLVMELSGGGYRMISGHRRLKAYQKLNARELRETQGTGDKWSKIPAVVIGNKDEITEEIALITANSTARERTYAEKQREYERMRELLEARKAAGAVVPKSMGGYIANALGTSRNEVSRMKSVADNLIPEAKEKVESGEMNAHTAYEMSRKPEAEQKQIFYGEKALETKEEKKMYGGYDKDAAIEKLRQEEQIRIKVLKTFAREWIGTFTRSAFPDFDDRPGAISALKKRYNGSGAATPDSSASWDAFGKGFRIVCGKTVVEATYAEVYDALCLEALRNVRDPVKADHGTVKMSVAPAWKTGAITEDGAYVCNLKISDDVVLQRLFYMQHGVLYMDAGHRNIADINGFDLVRWLKLPD